MSKLSGKVAIVTGASKGIGASIAKSLAAEGASVVVNYASSKEGADRVVEAIKAAGGKAVAVKGDVSKAADASAVVDAAIKTFGRLDVLINNAGVYEMKPLEEITEEHFHKTFDINVLGLLLVSKEAAKHLGKGGSIINIGSGVTRLTSTPPPRAPSTPSPVCSPGNLGRRASGSIPSIQAWSRPKGPTPPASSAQASRIGRSPRRRWDASASLQTSQAS